MKKRLLSALLTLALVFVLLPTTALAETTTPAESDVYVASTRLYKNTAYTIQDGKPVEGGTYPDDYNIYLDTTGSNYVLHVKNATIEATYTGIYGVSNIVFEGTNRITAGKSGIISYSTLYDLNISGSGSLTINTTGYPAIATEKTSIIIGGNVNVTATTTTEDITTEKNGIAVDSAMNLTISDTAKLSATSSYVNSSAIRVGNVSENTAGNLTVNSGATLTATSTSTKPTVQATGSASFTGSTVTITNNSTELHQDAADATKGDSVSSALYVKGNINITDNANVTAKVENGGGNAIGAVGNITVNGSNVTAANNGQKFTTIIAKNVYVSGDSTIIANNLKGNAILSNWYLNFPAIEGNIVNQNTDYSLKFEGEHNRSSEPKTSLAPGEQTTLFYYKVTITCGDEVVRTESPVIIAGTTLLNDTYYTITNGSTVAKGTASNYNAFYDSATKTLKLNNAVISHSYPTETGDGTDGAIIFKGYGNHFIELSGTNTISSTNTYAINCNTGILTIKNAAGAENAKLTSTSNWMVICSIGGLNIQSDVTMVNTKEAGYLMYVNDTFSFEGYNAYASVNASGSPLVEYTVPASSDKDAGYQYLRITKETLETGGGSPHQHTWSKDWYDVDKDYHAHKCTGCNEYDLTNKQAHYAWPDENKGSEGHTEKCMLCDYKYDQSVIKPHEWVGWWVSDYQPEVHAQWCNCGYQGSTHRTLKYVAIDSNYHQKQCPINGCGYKIDYKASHVYEEGSNICKDCGYNKSTGTTCEHEWVTDQHWEQGVTVFNDYHYASWCSKCHAVKDKEDHAWNVISQIILSNGQASSENHSVDCKCKVHHGVFPHEFDANGVCVGCGYTKSTTPGTIVIIRPTEEEKPAQQPNPSTGANDLVGMAVAAAVVAVLGSVALLRKHD